MKRLIALGLSLVMLVGCATIKIESPAGVKLHLGKNANQSPVIAKRHFFFILWGLVPVSDNSTAAMLSGKDSSEITVKTYYDIIDCLINFFLCGTSIISKSVQVRGE